MLAGVQLSDGGGVVQTWYIKAIPDTVIGPPTGDGLAAGVGNGIGIGMGLGLGDGTGLGDTSGLGEGDSVGLGEVLAIAIGVDVALPPNPPASAMPTRTRSRKPATPPPISHLFRHHRSEEHTSELQSRQY